MLARLPACQPACVRGKRKAAAEMLAALHRQLSLAKAPGGVIQILSLVRRGRQMPRRPQPQCSSVHYLIHRGFK